MLVDAVVEAGLLFVTLALALGFGLVLTYAGLPAPPIVPGEQ